MEHSSSRGKNFASLVCVAINLPSTCRFLQRRPAINNRISPGENSELWYPLTDDVRRNYAGMQTDLTTLPLSGNIYNGMSYSDMTLVASVSCMVGLVVICRPIAGFRTFAKGLPMGGTNSAVISAACHVRYQRD
jgi:hypothetical protein